MWNDNQQQKDPKIEWTRNTQVEERLPDPNLIRAQEEFIKAVTKLREETRCRGCGD